MDDLRSALEDAIQELHTLEPFLEPGSLAALFRIRLLRTKLENFVIKLQWLGDELRPTRDESLLNLSRSGRLTSVVRACHDDCEILRERVQTWSRYCDDFSLDKSPESYEDAQGIVLLIEQVINRFEARLQHRTATVELALEFIYIVRTKQPVTIGPAWVKPEIFQIETWSSRVHAGLRSGRHPYREDPVDSEEPIENCRKIHTESILDELQYDLDILDLEQAFMRRLKYKPSSSDLQSDDVAGGDVKLAMDEYHVLKIKSRIDVKREMLRACQELKRLQQRWIHRRQEEIEADRSVRHSTDMSTAEQKAAFAESELTARLDRLYAAEFNEGIEAAKREIIELTEKGRKLGIPFPDLDFDGAMEDLEDELSGPPEIDSEPESQIITPMRFAKAIGPETEAPTSQQADDTQGQRAGSGRMEAWMRETQEAQSSESNVDAEKRDVAAEMGQMRRVESPSSSMEADDFDSDYGIRGSIPPSLASFDGGTEPRVYSEAGTSEASFPQTRLPDSDIDGGGREDDRDPVSQPRRGTIPDGLHSDFWPFYHYALEAALVRAWGGPLAL